MMSQKKINCIPAFSETWQKLSDVLLEQLVNETNIIMQLQMSHVVHYTYVTGFGKIGLNAANNFFQYPRIKPYGSIFFEKIFMAEMDRHQLALAYDAVVSSGVL